MKIKKIAVLTSGGDAPGMNSALYGVYSACVENNIKLMGIIGGYEGLIDNNFITLDFERLNGRITDGGSVLKSSRSPRFLKNANFNKALKNLKNNKIDALVVIGGDGSIKGSIKLRDAGVNIVSIPGTIDNDLNFSFTLGYDTALNNIVNALDNITDSLSAFNYGGVVKVMGRDCNDLIEGAANAIYTPLVIKTQEFDINKLVKDVKKIYLEQHLPPIVLVREDCIDVNELANILQEKCKFQVRAHILGYIQRGGAPSAFDRKYGYTAGRMAIDCILNNETGVVIGIDGTTLTKKSFEDTVKFNKK